MRVDRFCNAIWSRLAVLAALAALAMLVGCDDESGSAAKFDGNMVLAISWQPAFCETRSRTPECRSQGPDRFDAHHFSLHGLWPQPHSRTYCGVAESIKGHDTGGRWRKLDPLKLPDEVSRELKMAMPGTRSHLDRHEWVKHGTCYSEGVDTYYRDSLHLLRQINESPVRDMFSTSLHSRLSGTEIRRAFDQSFGEGAGERVRISCKRDGSRLLIVELTIGLSGQISEDRDLGELMLAAPATNPGCPGGVVDGVGFQ